MRTLRQRERENGSMNHLCIDNANHIYVPFIEMWNNVLNVIDTIGPKLGRLRRRPSLILARPYQ